MKTKTENISMEISRQLGKLLNESGMSISELSRKVDISSKTLHNWSVGQKPRDIDQVKKVSDFFGISVDELCFGIKDKNRESKFENHREEINAGIYEVVLRKIK